MRRVSAHDVTHAPPCTDAALQRPTVNPSGIPYPTRFNAVAIRHAHFRVRSPESANSVWLRSRRVGRVLAQGGGGEVNRLAKERTMMGRVLRSTLAVTP